MKNFFDLKDKKITEKAFSKNIIISIAGILLSIIMLCSTTYAWFTASVASNTNKIDSGHFSIDVVSVVNDVTGNAVSPDSLGVYTLDAGKYIITLAPTEASTVKGYCIVTINDVEYRTEIIVNDETVTELYPTSNSPFVFRIVVDESATLEVSSRWGVPTNPDITAGTTIDTTSPQP